jgi:hypothetical protein
MEKKVKWKESWKGHNEWTKETRVTCTGRVPGCNPGTSSADWNLSKCFYTFACIEILAYHIYTSLSILFHAV